MTKMEKVAVGLLSPINPYASILLGIFTFFWGLWLALPFDTFGSAAIYSKMDQFAPEWLWAVWAMIVGSVSVYTIIKRKSKLLAKAHGFTAWHWATVASMMWWGDWENTAGPTYTFIAIYSSFCYLNVKVNNVNFGEEIRTLTHE